MSRRQSWVVLAVFVTLLVSVSGFGLIAHFERSVHTEAIKRVVTEMRGSTSEDVPTFVSKPHQCKFRDTVDGRTPDPILHQLNAANLHRARPVSLESAGHLAPILPRSVNEAYYEAGFLGLDDSDVVYVSRVGFADTFSRAAVCLRHAHSAHGYGVIFLLERDGLGWTIVATETSSIAT